jgi:hypothetical protein
LIGAFPAGFHAATEGGRFEYKTITRVPRLRDLLDQRPARRAADLFVTSQNYRHRELRLQIKLRQCAQHLEHERAIRFHVKHARTIRPLGLPSPGTFGQRTARMHRVSVTNEHDLSGLALLLESLDNQVLPETGHFHALHVSNTFQTPSRVSK